MDIRRVSLMISGGIAGLVRRAEADAADIGPGERLALERHVVSGSTVGHEPGRDLLTYALEVHAGAGVHRLAFDELTVPADLAALVHRLDARSWATNA